MPGFVLRYARLRDAAGIAHVQHVSWRQAYLGMLPHEVLIGMGEAQGVSFWRAVLERSEGEGAVQIAELDGEVAGFISFGPIRQRIAGYSGEFYALYVLPQAQGCGIGTALMAGAGRCLVRHRWSGAVVWVLEENSLGRSFYERLGGLPLSVAKALHYGGRLYPAVREVAYGWPDLRQAAWLAEH